MNRKIPSDAFEQYVALGPGRSYEALRKVFGVNKRSIVKLATKEKWQERLAGIERPLDEVLDEFSASLSATRGQRDFSSVRTLAATHYDLVARDGTVDQAKNMLRQAGLLPDTV